MRAAQHQHKNITIIIPYHFISELLNAKFYFNVSFTNDVEIDVTTCKYMYSLLDKVMHGSPCPEVRAFTNENVHHIMALNDENINNIA